jgi:hypothetical protein
MYIEYWYLSKNPDESHIYFRLVYMSVMKENHDYGPLSRAGASMDVFLH